MATTTPAPAPAENKDAAAPPTLVALPKATEPTAKMNKEAVFDEALRVRQALFEEKGLPPVDDPFQWKTIASLDPWSQLLLLHKWHCHAPTTARAQTPSTLRALFRPLHPTHVIVELYPPSHCAKLIKPEHALLKIEEAEALFQFNPVMYTLKLDSGSEKVVRLREFHECRRSDYLEVEGMLKARASKPNREVSTLEKLAPQAYAKRPSPFPAPVPEAIPPMLPMTVENAEKPIWDVLNVKRPTSWKEKCILHLGEGEPDALAELKYLTPNTNLEYQPALGDDQKTNGASSTKKKKKVTKRASTKEA